MQLKLSIINTCFRISILTNLGLKPLTAPVLVFSCTCNQVGKVIIGTLNIVTYTSLQNVLFKSKIHHELKFINWNTLSNTDGLGRGLYWAINEHNAKKDIDILCLS